MFNRKLAVLALCCASAVSVLRAQDVFLLGGSSSTDPQVEAFTAHPLTPAAGFQAGAGSFLVLSTPNGGSFYTIANSATQPVTATNSSFGTTNSPASFTQAPTAALITPDGTKLAVAAGKLYVFDTSSNNELVSGGISVANGANIIDVAVSLDGKSYFTLATLSGGGSQLNSINTATNTITGTLGVLGTATGVTVGPNNLVYVSTINQILEVNPLTLTTTSGGVTSLNASPTKPVITPDGKFLLVGNLTPVTGSSLILISLATHAIAATFPDALNFPFIRFLVLGANEILGATSQGQGYYMINPNNGGPIAVQGFSLPGVAAAITGAAVSDEVGAGPRNTAETLFAATGATLYSYDLPTNTVTANQTATDSNLGGAVSFAGAASTGTQPSTLLGYGVNQTVATGGVSLPLVAQALDSTGRPVYGATITFTPNSGAISVSPKSAVTGANGYAVTYVTASNTTGSTSVVAASGAAQVGYTINVGSLTGGGGSVGDIVTIVAGQGQLISGDNNTTMTGYSPLTVQITNSSGDAVPGAAVTFAITSGGGMLSPASGFSSSATVGKAPGSYVITADSNGEAAVNYFAPALNLGTAYLQSAIVATGPNAATATFYETAGALFPIPSAYLLKPSQGASLTGQAGTTLTGAVQVEVVSGQDQLLPNIAISLTNGGLSPTKYPSASCATTNGGALLTGSNGTATCDVVLGGIIGTGTFSVNIGNYLTTPTFQITITVGPPAVVDIVAGNNQSGNPGQQLPQALVVEVTDSSGNLLADTPVSFQVLTKGAVTLTNVSSSTDQNGRASALATLGSIAGQAQVQVNAGSASAVFTLTTTIPEAAIQKISGDGQSATVSTAFASPLVVKVVDANNNPVQSAQVNFAVTGGSATLGNAQALTDATGQASTTVTAGATAGTITVSATSAGFAVTFTLTATPVAPPTPGNITFENGASFQAGIAPGGVAIVSGTNIAPNLPALVTSFEIVGPPPTSFEGVSITFNGTLAPIYYISNANGQQSVAVQVPFEVQPGSAVSVVVTSASGASTTVNTAVQQVAPGVFASGTTSANQSLAVVVRSDGSYVSANNPAQRGEVVQLYVTGLGVVSPAAPTGAAGLGGQSVVAQLLVGLNNGGIPFQSADYAPGLVGVYVITFQVPLNTVTGPSQPVGLLIFDSAGNSYYGQSTYIPIQ